MLIGMILASIAYALCLAGAVMMVVLLPMAFDAGYTPTAKRIAITVLIFPVALILAMILAWCGFGFRRYWLIPIGLLLPWMDFALLLSS